MSKSHFKAKRRALYWLKVRCLQDVREESKLIKAIKITCEI